MFPSSRRPGLTLLELLVVFVLIVTLLGLGIMLLQRQRALGLRVQCMGNLKRLGEAVQAFHEHSAPEPGQRFLPAARIADGYATWAVLLGPHLFDEHPLLEWDVRKPYLGQPEKVRQAIVPAYFCPARDRPPFVSVGGALGDYAAVYGDGDPAHPWNGPRANGPLILGDVIAKQGDLILQWRGRTSFADLARGLAYTLMIGEKHVPADRLGDPLAGDGPVYDGSAPAFSGRVGGPGYALAAGPTAPAGVVFGGSHPGVCLFVHADTSVRALAVDTDAAVLGRLCRRGE